jgi:bifunctional polynucleotide phosphatase/kinase
LIFVGSPGSGKSTFWREYLKSKGYERANNDDTGSSKKTEALCLSHLKAGKSVVVDNTNPKAENRKTYIKMAKDLGIKYVRCLYFDIPKDRCMENNSLRKVGTHMSKNVPSVCIHTFFKNHEMPRKDEGFTSDIIKIKFV